MGFDWVVSPRTDRILRPQIVCIGKHLKKIINTQHPTQTMLL